MNTSVPKEDEFVRREASHERTLVGTSSQRIGRFSLPRFYGQFHHFGGLGTGRYSQVGDRGAATGNILRVVPPDFALENRDQPWHGPMAQGIVTTRARDD
jgi:hypothetical protein